MNSQRVVARCALAVLAAGAAVLLVKCTIQKVEGPQFIPQPFTEVRGDVKIPDQFVGCWRGTITSFDAAKSYSPLISDSSIKATGTTYEFCFDKLPDGSGRLELTDVEVNGRQSKVTYFQSRPTSLDTEHLRATMRSHAKLESTAWILIFPLHITQDIYVDETLQMTSPDVVAVQGKQWVVIGGNLIADMTFHLDFNRVSRRGSRLSSPTPRGRRRGRSPDELARALPIPLSAPLD